MRCLLGALLTIWAAAAQAQMATITIGCSGYNRSLNDYVEHYGRISGAAGEFDGEPVIVSTTPSDFILNGAKTQIRINRTTGTWVILGPHGRRPALEWSRGGKERCYFSN